MNWTRFWPDKMQSWYHYLSRAGILVCSHKQLSSTPTDIASSPCTIICLEQGYLSAPWWKSSILTWSSNRIHLHSSAYALIFSFWTWHASYYVIFSHGRLRLQNLLRISFAQEIQWLAFIWGNPEVKEQYYYVQTSSLLIFSSWWMD
jgi:hypothetical protein